MTALPPSSNFTSPSAVEGDQKGFIDNLRLFLVGLLGADGTVATGLATLGALGGVYAAKTAAYTVQLADRGQMIDATANTWTLSLPAVASAGAGFSLILRDSGAGIITIDPSGAELVDGVTTVAVPPGQAVVLVCTGTAWVTHWLVGVAFTSTARGLAPASGGGTVNFLRADGSWAPPSIFADNAFTLQDNGDATKQVQLELSGITTATTRTLTVPNASGTIDLTNNVATLTNKSIDLASNTLTTTKAQLNAAITGDDAVFLSGINGPVSMDVAGVATGAIIEEGVNKNGRYIKFANGWMMATREAFVMGRCATANGSAYRSASTSWTFPVAFVTEPIVNGQADDVDVEISCAAPSTTAVAVRTQSAVSKSVILTSKLTAIGRWATVGAASPAAPSGLRFWYDMQDVASLWQDTAASTAVTQPTDPVGRVNDKSGNGYHLLQATAGKRPLYQIDADGHAYIDFDGVDDFLSVASVDFSASSAITILAAVRKSTDATQGTIVELSANYTANAGAFRINNVASASYAVAASGTANNSVNLATFTAPHTGLITLQANIATPGLTGRVNGAQINTSSATLGTGNFGAALPLFVGMRNGTSIPYQGRIYGLIGYAGALSAADLKAVEDWLNQRTGAY